MEPSEKIKGSPWREALVRSLPILLSYVFISMAYGMMMADAGFPWTLALLTSLTVYTGAYQFMLISLLSGGAALPVIALTALLMNSRQAFYGLTFLDTFRAMGKWEPYMVLTMTDETYAVNCSLPADMPGRSEVMRHVAFLSRVYWMLGTVCGALLGQALPWNLEGIDFCMTALFIIILMDQLRQASNRLPVLAGGGVAAACLFIFGGSSFILPALLATSSLLLLMGRKGEKA